MNAVNPSISISQSYEQLFQKYPSIRPSVTGSSDYLWKFCEEAWRAIFNEDTESDFPFRDAIPEYTALDLCFMSCMRACSARGMPVAIDPHSEKPQIRYGFNFDTVFVSVKNIHAIVEVMDEVMKVEKVKV